LKVLVTGGAGFIGSHIVEKLVQEGCQVVVIDNLSTGVRENIPSNVRFMEMDICSEKLMTIFKTEKFDAVLHLAAQTMVPVSLEKPDYDGQVNILGTLHVLEACRNTGVKRVVFSSTAATYGNANCLPVMEQTETIPTSFYGLSKLTVEKYLDLYHHVYGLDYVVLRYANVYGERQGDGGEGGVVSIFTRLIAAGKSLTIFGNGGQTRDFIYAGDVANANYQALLTPHVNTVYNVSTKIETRVNELVAILGQVAGKSVETVYVPVRKGDIYRSMLSNDKATQRLNWKPMMNLAEGVRRTYQSRK